MNNQTKNIEDEVIVKKEQKPFFIYRKVVKCISDGISFYTDNFLEFTLISLPFVVLLSLTSTFIPQFSFILEDIKADLLNFILQISIFGLLALLFTSILICITFEYLNQRYISNVGKINFISVYRNINGSLPKVLLYVLATLLLGIAFTSIFFFILSIESGRFVFEIIKVIALCLFTLLSIFVSVCYNMVLPSVMLGENKFIPNFLNGFKTGIFVFPKLLSASVFVVLVTSIISILLFSPIYVMTMVNTSANMSILNGDTVNLPEGFSLSLAITYFVVSLIYYYIHIALQMPFVYLYVSAKVDLDEKAKNELPLI